MISLSRSTAAMLIALTATAAAESSPRTSADMLLPGCEILIGADPRGSAELLADAGHCYGLIEGLSYASRALGFCPPADATLAQMARVIIAYIEARPERMHENLPALAVEAQRRAWPCT
jgi:hypothetical protein